MITGAAIKLPGYFGGYGASIPLIGFGLVYCFSLNYLAMPQIAWGRGGQIRAIQGGIPNALLASVQYSLAQLSNSLLGAQSQHPKIYT